MHAIKTDCFMSLEKERSHYCGSLGGYFFVI